MQGNQFHLVCTHVRGTVSTSVCTQVDTCDADFDPAFLRHMFPKIEWEALVEGAKALGTPCIWASFVLNEE